MSTIAVDIYALLQVANLIWTWLKIARLFDLTTPEETSVNAQTLNTILADGPRKGMCGTTRIRNQGGRRADSQTIIMKSRVFLPQAQPNKPDISCNKLAGRRIIMLRQVVHLTMK